MTVSVNYLSVFELRILISDFYSSFQQAATLSRRWCLPQNINIANMFTMSTSQWTELLLMVYTLLASESFRKSMVLRVSIIFNGIIKGEPLLIFSIISWEYICENSNNTILMCVPHMLSKRDTSLEMCVCLGERVPSISWWPSRVVGSFSCRSCQKRIFQD